MHYGIHLLPIGDAFDANAVDRFQHPIDFDTNVLAMPWLLPSDPDWELIFFEDEAKRLHGGPGVSSSPVPVPLLVSKTNGKPVGAGGGGGGGGSGLGSSTTTTGSATTGSGSFSAMSG